MSFSLAKKNMKALKMAPIDDAMVTCQKGTPNFAPGMPENKNLKVPRRKVLQNIFQFISIFYDQKPNRRHRLDRAQYMIVPLTPDQWPQYKSMYLEESGLVLWRVPVVWQAPWQ